MAAGLRHKRSAHSWGQEAGVHPDTARKTLPELIGISPHGWTRCSSAQGVIPDSSEELGPGAPSSLPGPWAHPEPQSPFPLPEG